MRMTRARLHSQYKEPPKREFRWDELEELTAKMSHLASAIRATDERELCCAMYGHQWAFLECMDGTVCMRCGLRSNHASAGA